MLTVLLSILTAVLVLRHERRHPTIASDRHALGFFTAKELAAGGQIKKELAHFERGARGAGGGFDFKNFPSADDDLCAFR